MVSEREFFWGSEETSPPNTYSAALARGLPSKGEMRRASIHEQYDVGTGESASRTGDYGTGGANRRLGKARKAERTGTSGTGETCHVLKTVYSYFVSLIYVFHFLS